MNNDVDVTNMMYNTCSAGADYDKRTPLHLACSEGHMDIALLLLSHGADLDAVDRFVVS